MGSFLAHNTTQRSAARAGMQQGGQRDHWRAAGPRWDAALRSTVS
ncbi:MAG: hypothetical protein AAGF95_35230 [Chloroflexota bacterium]